MKRHTVVQWEDFPTVAALPLSFEDICAAHPRLAEYYNPDDVSRRAEREAAADFFVTNLCGKDKAALALKEKVIRKWATMGLLEKEASVPFSLGTVSKLVKGEGKPVGAKGKGKPAKGGAKGEKGAKVTDTNADAPVRIVGSEPTSLFETKVRMHRHDALVQREKSVQQQKNEETLREREDINERRKAGLQRDFKDSEVVRGVVTLIDLERRQGEVFVAERSCATSFNLDWVEFGLKQVKVNDEVSCVVTSRSGPARGGRTREQAIGIRPAIPRKLIDDDIVTFCKECQAESKDPEKILFRVLTSIEDFHNMCQRLNEKPESISSSAVPGKGLSWFECVMSLVQLAAFPYLQEPRFRSIITKFYQLMPLTPFPALVEECCKFASDDGNVQFALDIGVFVDSMRLFCFHTGGVHDLSEKYFESIVGLLDRCLTGTIDKNIPVHSEESLRVLCASIRSGPDERKLFPSSECFRHNPCSTEHPLHYTQLPDTQYLPWENVNDYVGCHFNLLKADCFFRVVCSIMYRLGFDGYEVREQERKDMEFNTTQYTDLGLVGEALGDKGVWLALKFELPEYFVPESSLEKGALICICILNENGEPPQMWWATVAFTDIDMSTRGMAAVEIIDGDPRLLAQRLQINRAYGKSGLCVMFETKLFFYAFKPVLEALEYLRRQVRLPFNDTLLKGSVRSEVKALPQYVPPCYKDAFYNIVKRMLHSYTFEPGQHKALRWLPHRPVLLVQGPPGTGKSFIGCRLVECIAEFRIKLQSGELKNEYQPPMQGEKDREDEKPGPILVLTYKNHSLDEFLTDVLDTGVWCGSLRDATRCICKSGGNPSKFCCKMCCERQGHNKRLVRVGARSQSPRLMKYNLAQLAKPRNDHKHKLRSLRMEAERLSMQIRRLDSGVVDDSTIRSFMSAYQIEAFTKENTVSTEAAWAEWVASSEPLFPPADDAQALMETGREILQLSVDPVSIDAAVVKEKNYASMKAKSFEEKQEQKVGDKENEEKAAEKPRSVAETTAAMATASAEAAAETDEGAKSTALQYSGKGADTSIEHDIVSTLRVKRAFYQSFTPQAPTPPCRIAIEDDDHLVTAALQQTEAAQQHPEGIPAEVRTGRLLPPIYAEVEDLWSLEPPQRRELAGFWIARLRREIYKKFRDTKLEFEGMLVIDQASYDEARFRVLSGADIIGLTTTGAAMNQGILRSVKPSVLMVEEAAEILEGQILSCFVDSIKQVILIGDHKQLRPQTDDRNFAERNNFNVSMFQRLIETCKVPYVHLTEQRRMCAKVADIIRPMYEELSDFSSLQTRKMDWGPEGSVKQIPGTVNPVIFWDHDHPEEPSSIGLSVMNRREVAMVEFLLKVLVCEKGIRQKQITVLSPYLGQTRALQYSVKQRLGMEEVECLTVDRFQGDENDIIIISLVRTENLTTFLKLENRMCVACSRARFGFFMVGNSKLLNNVPHWKRTLDIIGSQHPMSVSKTLCLQKPGSNPPQYVTANSAQEKFPDPLRADCWSSERGDGVTITEEMDVDEEE